MANQAEVLNDSGTGLVREIDELFIVAEGIVQNAWLALAEQEGVFAGTKHKLLESTYVKLGHGAAKSIIGYDEEDRFSHGG